MAWPKDTALEKQAGSFCGKGYEKQGCEWESGASKAEKEKVAALLARAPLGKRVRHRAQHQTPKKANLHYVYATPFASLSPPPFAFEQRIPLVCVAL